MTKTEKKIIEDELTHVYNNRIESELWDDLSSAQYWNDKREWLSYILDKMGYDIFTNSNVIIKKRKENDDD